MARGDFIVQEADGTPVALDDYDSQAPYPSTACNANSVGATSILCATKPRRPAGYQSGLCCDYKLPALAADPHSLPD